VYTVTAVPYKDVDQVGSQSRALDYTRAASVDVTITIAERASESVIASGSSSAWLTTTASNSGASGDTTPSVPAAVSATNTPRAYVYVTLLNAAAPPLRNQ